MAKQRMAGERLSQEEQNRRAREKRANDPEQLQALMGKVDRDAYDFEGYGDKAIAMAFQGDSFGDEDYARLTGKPMGGLDNDPDPDPDPNPTEPVVTTPGGPTVTPTPEVPGAGVDDLINVINALPTPTDDGPTPSTTGTFNVNQIQSFDRNFGDNQNTIGDDAKVYGNLNQGNKDFSFNFGYQRAF